MEARGTIWRQIRKLKRAMKHKKQEDREEVEDDRRKSHLLTMMSLRVNINFLAWAAKTLSRLFDPVSQEWAEDEVRKFDPMEHPVHSKRMKARAEEFESGFSVGWT
ncbi:hypothetical protein QQX98_006105 [Neonectria punicea]|uniref:Uncharacterized protein n=1 Tax=Neonectria punicea TaxID=979145 RepID=A0ABR1H2A4_9HYPO